MTVSRHSLILFAALTAIAMATAASVLGAPTGGARRALLIGGTNGTSGTGQNDFTRMVTASAIGLREKGYSVTSMFLDHGPPAADLGRAQASTAQNLRQELQNLLLTAHPGDQIELLIAADGELHQGKHHIRIVDGNGKPVAFPTAEIAATIRALDKKGAKVTAVFNSCASGALRDIGELKRACLYFGSAGEALSQFCGENDPEESVDYTSTTEYVTMRYYRHAVKRLEEMPYFSKSRCFQKTLRHFRELNLSQTANTVASTYALARKADLTFNEPWLNVHDDISYFNGGYLSRLKKADCPDCLQKMEDILTNFPGSTTEDPGQALKRAALRQEIDSYHKAVDAQKRALEAYRSQRKPPLLTAIWRAQEAVEKQARAVIRAEREATADAIDGLIAAPGRSEACKREL